MTHNYDSLLEVLEWRLDLGMYYKLIEWTIFGHIWTDYKRQVPLQLQIRGQSVALINKDVTGKISMSGVEPEMDGPEVKN